MEENRIKPIADRILIKKDDKEVEKNGVLMASKVQTEQLKGTVIEVGVTAEIVKKGDRVLFGTYAGTNIGNNLIIMKEVEALAII